MESIVIVLHGVALWNAGQPRQVWLWYTSNYAVGIPASMLQLVSFTQRIRLVLRQNGEDLEFLRDAMKEVQDSFDADAKPPQRDTIGA